MSENTLVGLIVTLILLIILVRRYRNPWPDSLHRLHAGVRNQAEWMAPEEVLHAVEADYLAAQQWTTDITLSGYASFVSEAPQFYTGAYLRWQGKIAGQYLKPAKQGVKFIGV